MNKNKVKKGLECCSANPVHDCDDCPYNEEAMNYPCRSEELKRDAIELLNSYENDLKHYAMDNKAMREMLKAKEEAFAEPILNKKECGTFSFKCGECKRDITYRAYYCQWCGIPIKWD